MSAEENDESAKLPDAAVAALKSAMEASTKKDMAISEALRRMRNATRRNLVILLAILVSIGYGAYQFHQFDSRSVSDQKLLVCTAKGVNTLGKDLRHAVVNQDRNRSAYPLPSECQIVP